MAKYGIQRHSETFDRAKGEISRMSQQAPRSSQFTFVPTEGTGLGGFFFGTNHDVTGAELNNLIREIQSNFSRVHTSTLQLFSALNSVYTAFDSLDKDYISYIIKNLEATSAVADQANKLSQNLSVLLQKTKERLEEVKRDSHSEVCQLDHKMQNVSADIEKLRVEVNGIANPKMLYVLGFASITISIVAIVLSIVL